MCCHRPSSMLSLSTHHRNVPATQMQRGRNKEQWDRERRGRWHVPLLLGAYRTDGPTDTCAVWSHRPFSVPTSCLMIHPFFIASICRLYTHMLHIPIWRVYFCFSFICSHFPFPNIFPTVLLFLFCRTTFEVCHSFCFAASYSLISTTAFVTLVQLHSQ